MALATNQIFRFDIKASQWTQAVNVSFDYQLVSGNAVPLEEVTQDLRSYFKSWIFSWLVDDLVIHEYSCKVYDHLIYQASVLGSVERLLIRYGEQFVISGDSSDHGGSQEEALPTYCTVSGKKVPSGTCTKFQHGGGTVAGQTKDVPFRERVSISGLQENFTFDNQGNELATTIGANWMNTWQDACTRIVAPSFREGTVGQVYGLRMQIRSERGRGGAVRLEGGNPYIMFCPVTSISVSKYLGSQLTRKQKKKFQ